MFPSTEAGGASRGSASVDCTGGGLSGFPACSLSLLQGCQFWFSFGLFSECMDEGKRWQKNRTGIAGLTMPETNRVMKQKRFYCWFSCLKRQDISKR